MTTTESPAGGLDGGPVWEATRNRLTALEKPDEALAAMALDLARAQDEATGAAKAQIAKELRATLKELTPDDGGDAFADFLAELPAPVRDGSTAR